MLWQFLTWWCSLFGITSPQAIETVAAVVVGGLLLGIAYLLLGLLLTIFTGGFRRT